MLSKRAFLIVVAFFVVCLAPAASSRTDLKAAAPSRVLIVQANGKVDRLYAVDPTTKKAHLLREPLGETPTAILQVHARNPVWSHDGAFIAFSSARPTRFSYNSSLFVMRRDGSGKRKLADNVDVFRWSPSADVLAFSDDPRKGIYVAEPTGQARRIARPGGNPQWRADGMILFERDYGELMTVGRGQAPALLATDLQDFYVSPDGKLIAFHKMGLAGAGPLEIMTAWGKKRHTVHGAASPVWSPDSRRLAFLSGFKNTVALYLVDVASDTVRVVRKKPLRIRGQFVWPHHVEWDPSGTRFALEAEIPVGSGQQAKGFTKIWTMNLDGSGLRTLRTGWSYDPLSSKFPYAGLSLVQWERAANTLRWETQ